MKTTKELRDFFIEMLDEKPVNFTTISDFLPLKPQTVFY